MYCAPRLTDFQINDLRATVDELRRTQPLQVAAQASAPSAIPSSSSLREPMFTPDLEMHTGYDDSSPDRFRRPDVVPSQVVSLSKPGNHNMQNRPGDYNPSDMPRPDGMHVQMAALVAKPELQEQNR